MGHNEIMVVDRVMKGYQLSIKTLHALQLMFPALLVLKNFN